MSVSEQVTDLRRDIDWLRGVTIDQHSRISALESVSVNFAERCGSARRLVDVFFYCERPRGHGGECQHTQGGVTARWTA